MSVRIYVGNLNFKTSDQELRDAFSAHGEVEEVFIASDRETGRPRGFGFVTMRDGKEAQVAIEQLNGTDLGGRNIVVNEARPREAQGGGGGGGGGRGGGYKGGRGGRDRDSW
jgi:RNA recognition motif-containing protein